MAERNMAQVFNIKLVDFVIDEIHSSEFDFTEIDPVEGISSDGFGITPTAETEVIEGLKGELGFSVDPGDGAEITLTLKSNSPHVPKMLKMWNAQRNGALAPFRVAVTVRGDETVEGTGQTARDAFGFSQIMVEHVMLQNYAAFETEERDAPDYEFEMIGYGMRIRGPDEDPV